MIQIKVNDTYLDLLGQDDARVTFAVNDFGNLNSRQGFQSTDFTVPATAKNISILNTQNRLTAEVLDNDTLLGLGFVQTVSRGREANTFTISFFLGNSDWFDLLSGVNIRDFNYDEFDHFWTAADVIDSFENQSGYTYPIIDYGKLSDRAGQAIMVTELFPATYVHTIIKKAFSSINYKIAGSILKNPFYLRKTLPYSSEGDPTYDETTKNLLTLNVNQPVPQTIEVTFSGGPFKIDSIVPTQDKSNVFDSVNQEFSLKPGKYRMTGSYTVTIVTSDTQPISVFLTLFATSTPIGSITGTGSGSGEVFFDVEFDITDSSVPNYVFMLATAVGGTDFITISDFEFTVFPIGILEGSLMKLTSFLPDLPVLDLIKQLVFEFNLFFQVNPYTKTITFFQFDDIIRNLKKAPDWTSKIDYKNLTEDNFTEILQNYSRSNLLTYTESDDDARLVDYKRQNGVGFGDGSLDIDNEFLPASSNLYESPFTATINALTMDDTTNIPSIPIFELEDGEYEPNLDPGIRILFCLTGVAVSEFSSYSSLYIQEDGSSPILVESVPYAWFSKSEASGVLLDEDGTMAFGETIPPDNSPTLIDSNYRFYKMVLEDGKLIKLNAKLNLIDILNLDFSIPIYISYPYYAYFRINRVVEWSFKTRICRLELMKL